MAGQIGFTASLSLNDGGSNAHVAIANVKMITVPSQDTGTVETTTLGASTPHKTFTPALTDSGVLSFEANYTSATFTRLQAVLGKLAYGTARIPPTGVAVEWKITAPDEDGVGSGTAQTFTFGGILTKLDLSMEVEALMMIKAEVKVSGAITVG